MGGAQSAGEGHLPGSLNRLVRTIGTGDRPEVIWYVGLLPGRYQVGWREGGVDVRARSSGAGDRDERHRVGSDPGPLAL